jgi:hypothetical protein
VGRLQGLVWPWRVWVLTGGRQGQDIAESTCAAAAAAAW